MIGPGHTLVVGASGFIGSAAVRALAEAGHPVRGLVRKPAEADDSYGTGRDRGGVELVAGSLDDAASLRAACEGVATVIHAASYVGSDPEQCVQVNVDGTRRLLEATASAGVAQVAYVSTTAVYGTGPHRGIAVDGVPHHPESPASASRLAAEKLVLGAGGAVVRPNIVHGPGDRWFAPHLVSLVLRLGGLIEGGTARISAISVADLGSLLAGLAVRGVPAGSVLHAAYREPITVRDLLAQLAPDPELMPWAGSVPFEEAVEFARPLGFTRHQISMVAWDHWYASEAIWPLAGQPG
ncbi:NAD-dependent epimerase/dehydratase family protein [Sinomonas sp. JGH33]|uniref:NAD-dependent epimerase/dehydratase family protein n=1 Tax=Sinomonas terricola TaxID=3110330 RepID=A0ABU5T5Q9_9MICC|nr:NAD-dependent epimerase/dehydratase family protein [Sinomonas sp. JGH33]MEA5454826.1 NAD-dependent epimerase/dehydratase family protein [Sinomonas sp. JGH33]